MKEIAVFIIVVASVITYSSAHSCYVCGNGADEPFTRTDQQRSSKNTSMIPSNCDEFERSNDASVIAKFIRECPVNYQGCSVEVDKNQIIRTCEERPLNDCKMANNVYYCYCNTDLCNSKKASAIRTELRQLPKKQKFEKKKNAMAMATDDEDLEESSGMGESNNYSGERRRTWDIKNNINSNLNQETYGKTKQIITLAPVTEALNLTTPRPRSNNSSGARSLTINTKNVLSLLLILLGINLITIRNTSTTSRIKI